MKVRASVELVGRTKFVREIDRDRICACSAREMTEPKGRMSCGRSWWWRMSLETVAVSRSGSQPFSAWSVGAREDAGPPALLNKLCMEREREGERDPWMS